MLFQHQGKTTERKIKNKTATMKSLSLQEVQVCSLNVGYIYIGNMLVMPCFQYSFMYMQV